MKLKILINEKHKILLTRIKILKSCISSSSFQIIDLITLKNNKQCNKKIMICDLK